MTKKEIVLELLEGEKFTNKEMVEMWNGMCQHKDKNDYIIYSMSEFDELYCESSPLDIAYNVLSAQNFDTSDSYFSFYRGIYLASFNNVYDTDSIFDYNELAEYIAEFGDASEIITPEMIINELIKIIFDDNEESVNKVKESITDDFIINFDSAENLDEIIEQLKTFANEN